MTGIIFVFCTTGQGGYAYLKEWLWWAGLISSKTRPLTSVFQSWINGQLFAFPGSAALPVGPRPVNIVLFVCQKGKPGSCGFGIFAGDVAALAAPTLYL